MLRLEFSNHQKDPIWLVSSNLKIGRSDSNDIILDQDGISGFHALLTVESGHVFIKDTGSEKGTFLNNERITKKIELHAHDKIRMSDVDIEITEPSSTNEEKESKTKELKSTANLWSLQSVGDIHFNKPQPLEGIIIIGRDKKCDIIIDSTHISRKHCRLQIQGGVIHIKDLNSANGTYLNGKKITESYARPGDEICLQEEAFILNGPFVDQDKTVMLSATSLPPLIKEKISQSIDQPAPIKKSFSSKDNASNTKVRLDAIKEARDALQGTSSKHRTQSSLLYRLTILGGVIAVSALLFFAL
ncbi:MAG: hypothetical protein COB04_07965 [Gammaproteobacteria bacterium]|nr:MAG: hypothetical protein COB04_07965 [Gammaproteobacteria bacterium]